MTEITPQNAMDVLLAGCSMVRTKKSVEMLDGSKFEWWQTPLTLQQREMAQRQLPKKDKDNVLDLGLHVFALKATDENGQRLFQSAQVGDLKRKLPETVAADIMKEVFEDSLAEDFEDEETGEVTQLDFSTKNSKTPSKTTTS